MLAYHFRNRPLIYDPDDQAIHWLQSLKLERSLYFTKKSFISAAKIAEDAMKNGGILIVYIDGNLDNFTSNLINSIEACTEENRFLA